MSLASVLAAITFWKKGDPDPAPDINIGIPFTPDNQNDIKSYIQDLYNTSSIAQAYLDLGTSPGVDGLVKDILFVQSDVDVPGIAAPYIIGINLIDAIPRTYYFDNEGWLVT